MDDIDVKRNFENEYWFAASTPFLHGRVAAERSLNIEHARECGARLWI